MQMYKIADATRPGLFWICRIINHWFKWEPIPLSMDYRLHTGIAHRLEGTCRICGARRGHELKWPPPPKRSKSGAGRGRSLWVS